MPEVEDKTDHVNALVYTEETVQDKLYSSCSVNKQGQNLVVLDKICSFWTKLPYYSELSLDNFVDLCTQGRV